MSDVFHETTKAFAATINDYIKQRNRKTGEDPEEIAQEAGMAMLMVGCMWIGKSLGIEDPDIAYAPGKLALAEFEKLRT
jgi:hypothetical protein